MSNALEYRGYTSTVEFSAEDRCFHGKIAGIRDLVAYDGTTVDELEKNFHSAVDEYLAFCKEEGKAPDKPFKGSLNIRIPSELHRTLAERGGQRVLERYGMTETLMNVSNPYDGERRAGSVGLPLPGVELRLSNGQDGEIQLRGPNVFAGYWERPTATRECFTDGWFRTGDLGALDPDGYVRILGRSKELIISGGFNVYPREVEDTLKSHPAVLEAVAVGLPDEKWGERVAAAVTTRTPVVAADLEAFCAERMAGYKRPRRLEVWDAIPLSPVGKVLRRAARDRMLGKA